MRKCLEKIKNNYESTIILMLKTCLNKFFYNHFYFVKNDDGVIIVFLNYPDIEHACFLISIYDETVTFNKDSLVYIYDNVLDIDKEKNRLEEFILDTLRFFIRKVKFKSLFVAKFILNNDMIKNEIIPL